ncbi:hypothetical protein PWT90_05120 [Aphanocladium album]|nr:hypothetical protein PWT90_05120 [Aphanocladium album]
MEAITDKVPVLRLLHLDQSSLSNMTLPGVPSEVVSLILENCDTARDALALASTCKHMYHEWRKHGARAVWLIWKDDMHALDEALIAVRATQIVVDRQNCNQQLPVEMNLSLLSSEHRVASLPELSAISDLRRVVGLMCKKATSWVLYHVPEIDDGGELPEHLPECHNRIIKSMYRALAVAAALSGLYNEPTFEADPAITPENFSKVDKERLVKFAAYQIASSHKDEERMFGGVAEWLRDNILTEQSRRKMAKLHDERRGRGLCCRGYVDAVNNPDDTDDAGNEGEGKDDGDNDEDIFVEGDDDEEGGDDDGDDDDDDDDSCPLRNLGGLSHSDMHLLTWETLQMMWAAEAIRSCCSADSEFQETGDGTPLRTVHMVAFGRFRPVQVRFWTEAVTSPAEYAFLPARARGDETPSGFQKYYGIGGTASGWEEVLGWMHRESRQRNHYKKTSHPTAPLRLKLFGFLLRRFANVRPWLRFWQDEWTEQWNDLMTLSSSYMLFTSDEVEDREPCNQDLVDGGFTDGTICLETLRGKPKPELYFQEC